MLEIPQSTLSVIIEKWAVNPVTDLQTSFDVSKGLNLRLNY